MVNQVLRRKRINEEFRFSAQIGEYDVDNVILDLGSDANVLPKKMWELMGKPTLIWSVIQLGLANQHKIVSIGCLIGVPVNIDGVCNVANFEVIEIVDYIQPYPTSMGLEWDFENQEIIELKTREMIFEIYCSLGPITMKEIHRTNQRE
jgi:argininosuccinate synthase